ncbi:MAG: F-type H+-transporting ATPase subunit gamma [Pseudonocardiales bacterium]|jgi:F-type H+-transporting ATPase subunit gamma|nr:F-type H+-transporting ATPase subunit gamma [Pseudonocardiales bacterium]
MGAQLRVYRRRIRTVQSTKKITKAMELIAASRIAKAQARMKAARPYAEELTRALAALGKNASLEHPMLTGVESPQRAGILVVTSDRGLAGGYNANAIKQANALAARLRGEGRDIAWYVIGRKGVAYYRFRKVALSGSWTGFSEQPNFLDARDSTETVVQALTATSAGESNGEPGIDELYVVYTKFVNSVSQTPAAVQVSPVKSATDQSKNADDGDTGDDDTTDAASYEFEPEPEELIGALLPRYISARIFSALLESATSESAARRRAMKSASDNATELIRTYTRLANQARQAEITQEISEIVGGADALASAGSDQR